MEKYGGPVWHVSVAPRVTGLGEVACARRARHVLDGLGDPAAGEWSEWTGAAYHLRRRLTVDEAVRVGPVRDIRGTPEARRRARALGRYLDVIPAAVVAAELGDRPGPVR